MRKSLFLLTALAVGGVFVAVSIGGGQPQKAATEPKPDTSEGMPSGPEGSAMKS